jgi:hypothetical protein
MDIPSLVPRAEVGGRGFGTSAKCCRQCPAADYGGDAGRFVRMSPCAAAILERKRHKSERQEQENRERLERERIERLRKEIMGREQELKARQPYMCPGRVQMEKAAIMEAKKAIFAGEGLKLNDRNANIGSYSALFQRIQKTPVRHIPQKRVRWIKKLDKGAPGVYTTCDCGRRNGLQDDCKLTLCHGRPECLTDPPTCIPSQGY